VDDGRGSIVGSTAGRGRGDHAAGDAGSHRPARPQADSRLDRRRAAVSNDTAPAWVRRCPCDGRSLCWFPRPCALACRVSPCLSRGDGVHSWMQRALLCLGSRSVSRTFAAPCGLMSLHRAMPCVAGGHAGLYVGWRRRSGLGPVSRDAFGGGTRPAQRRW
jgi:hypothetical protein